MSEVTAMEAAPLVPCNQFRPVELSEIELQSVEVLLQFECQHLQ